MKTAKTQQELKQKSDLAFKELEAPQNNSFQTNEKSNDNWGNNFYEELANNPFVIGLYSSEFEDFFNKDKIEALNQSPYMIKEKTDNQNPITFLHRYITSINFTSSINAPYLSVDMNLKMTANNFHKYFHHSAANTPTTGQWIAIYTKNEKSWESSSELLPQIDKNFEFKENFEEFLKYKGVGNNDNNLGFKWQNEFLDKLLNDNDFERGLKTRQQRDIATKKSFEEYIKYNTQVRTDMDKFIKEFGDAVDEYLKKVEEDKQKHYCMFFGIVDNLTYKISANQTGIAMFDVQVRCNSFISSMERNQFLVALPRIEETVSGAVFNKALAEGITKNKNLKPVSAFIKDIDYWNAMIKNFSNSGVSKQQNLGYEIKKILLSLQRNYLPLDMHGAIVANPYSDPVSNEIINENRLLTLGAIVNVASEQQHLPTQSNYRQMLPLVSRYSSTVDRFKTTLSGKGTTWDLIRGTFQTDPNLIECFPVIIPFNSKKELKQIISSYTNNQLKFGNQFLLDGTTRPSFQPFFYDNAIYKFYEQLGGIPTIIYRLKPLQPNGQISKNNINSINTNAEVNAELIQNATYSEKLVKGKNLKIEYLQGEKTKQIDLNEQFGFEDKIPLNTDAPFADLLPMLHFNQLLNFECQQSEADRINGLYIENPAIRNKSNLTIGSFADPVIDIKDAMTQGFRYYESDYPYFDVYLADNSGQKEMSAINERFYAIYGAGQTRAKGQISLKMSYNPDILAGSWIRIIMDNPELKTGQNQGKFITDNKRDFFCYVEAISYSYSKETTINVICNIQFSRGTFGLNYAHFPNNRIENHLDGIKTYNEAAVAMYLDGEKSQAPKVIPQNAKEKEIYDRLKDTQFPANVSDEQFHKNILNDPKSRKNTATNILTTHTASDFNKLNNNFKITKKVPSVSNKPHVDILENVVTDPRQSQEEKRFESRETNVEFKELSNQVPLPLIQKWNNEPFIKFGPYKAGPTGPFPEWEDMNDDFILDDTEFNLLYPHPSIRLEKLIELNTDAIERGFEQLDEVEVISWQTENGYVPIESL